MARAASSASAGWPAPPGAGPARQRLGPGPLVPDGPRRLQRLAEPGLGQMGGQRASAWDRSPRPRWPAPPSAPRARARSRSVGPGGGPARPAPRTGTPRRRWPAPPPAPRPGGLARARRGASAASASDRDPLSPIARAASSASRRLGPARSAPGGGPARPAPWTGTPRLRWPAPPPAPRPGGLAPPGAGPAPPAPRTGTPRSPMARAASSASAGWPSSARRGASAASASDRDHSASDGPRRLQRLAEGLGSVRWGASAASASDRDPSSPMARAASSASAEWSSSRQTEGQRGQRPGPGPLVLDGPRRLQRLGRVA